MLSITSSQKREDGEGKERGDCGGLIMGRLIWPVFYFESWTHYYIKKLLQLYFKLWKEFPIKTKIPQKYTLKSETNWGNLADRWSGPKHFDLSPNYCHLGNKITRDTHAGEPLRAEQHHTRAQFNYQSQRGRNHYPPPPIWYQKTLLIYYFSTGLKPIPS